MSSDFLSCDWGTTSFRLRWITGPERTVHRQVHESGGVKFLHEQAQLRRATSAAERALVFEEFLRSKLQELIANCDKPSPLPLIVSGMASSSIGWHELPYARAPFALNGKGLLTERIEWRKPDWINRTLLISGVATEHEMMRGEECEIIGLMSVPDLAAFRKRALVILPGTHSKHVLVDDGSVVDFHTYMTGELFEVLGKQSILRASVDLSAPANDWQNTSEQSAFKEGVRCAREQGLAGALFRVRTRAVLHGQTAKENTRFLSGLLIGSELAGIAAAKERPVILAAVGHLSQLYSLAWESLGLPAENLVVPSPAKIESAVTFAHSLQITSNASEG